MVTGEKLNRYLIRRGLLITSLVHLTQRGSSDKWVIHLNFIPGKSFRI